MDAMIGDNTPLLVRRALDAQEEYKAAIGDETLGRRAAVKAIVDYGEALLVGREEYGGTKAFAAWVTDNQLDQGYPWSFRQHRTAAMNMARLAREHGLATFEGCPSSVPSWIMAWHRKQHPKPKPPERLKREATIAEKKQGELALTEDQQLAESDFSPKSKLTIKKAIAIHKRRLEKSFNTVVGERVRAEIARSDDHVRKAYDELRPRLAQLEALYADLQRSKGVFTKAEFRQLQMAVHPDNTAGIDTRNHLLNLLVKHESKLIKGD